MLSASYMNSSAFHKLFLAKTYYGKIKRTSAADADE
jgi:hypothetical protein